MKNDDEIFKMCELTEIDKKEINVQIDELIEQNKGDSQKMTIWAMQAVSLARAVESRSDEIEKQNILQRLFCSLTGKNQKISAKNINDVAKAQYLSSQMITILLKKNLIPIKLVSLLEEKIKLLSTDISQQNLRTKAICDILTNFLGKFDSLKTDVEILKRTQKYCRWAETIQYKDNVFKGKKYKDLSLYEKIVCIVCDFFENSGGIWDKEDLIHLKKALNEIEINPDEKVKPIEIIGFLRKYDILLEKFLPNWNYQIITTEMGLTPYLAAIHKHHLLSNIENLHANEMEKKEDIELNQIQLYVKKTANRSLSELMTVFDLVVDMTYDLSIYEQIFTKRDNLEKVDEDETFSIQESSINENDDSNRETTVFSKEEKIKKASVARGSDMCLYNEKFKELVVEDIHVTEDMFKAIDDI